MNKPTISSSKLDAEQNFRFAAALIKVIAFVIALMALVISKYAFIFFAAAMLPTILAIFFDRKHHKCASATICTFNLIGALPYLMRLWNSSSVNFMAKSVISDIDSWLVIYGSALAGQLLYVSLPLLMVRIYVAKYRVSIGRLKNHALQIAAEWGIEPEKQ